MPQTTLIDAAGRRRSPVTLPGYLEAPAQQEHEVSRRPAAR